MNTHKNENENKLHGIDGGVVQCVQDKPAGCLCDGYGTEVLYEGELRVIYVFERKMSVKYVKVVLDEVILSPHNH